MEIYSLKRPLRMALSSMPSASVPRNRSIRRNSLDLDQFTSFNNASRLGNLSAPISSSSKTDILMNIANVDAVCGSAWIET